MLPDYPGVRALISKHQMRQFHAARSESMGPFSDIREDPLHEGHRSGIIRKDGSLDELEFKTIEVTRTFKMDEMENWSEKQVREYYQDIAQEVARKQSRLTYEKLGEAVAKVGNEITEQGLPTAETILNALGKMWIDFNDDGTHVPLTIVSSSEMKPAYDTAFKQLDEDPALRKRYQELLEEKRLQWRERESSRKLVG